MGASIIIAAAGSSNRMNGTDKVLLNIEGKEIIAYSLIAFSKAKCTDKIVVVTTEEKKPHIENIIKKLALPIEIVVCIGDNTRQKSVVNGLEFCSQKSDCIMIHDAARPMITPYYIDLLYDEIKSKKAAALGVKVKDTIKKIDENGKIIETPDRNSLFVAQTPQGFEMQLYKRAVETAIKNGRDYTDDCQLVEAMGESVYMVECDYRNIKITTPEDILSAQNFLKEQ